MHMCWLVIVTFSCWMLRELFYFHLSSKPQPTQPSIHYVFTHHRSSANIRVWRRQASSMSACFKTVTTFPTQSWLIRRNIPSPLIFLLPLNMWRHWREMKQWKRILRIIGDIIPWKQGLSISSFRSTKPRNIPLVFTALFILITMKQRDWWRNIIYRMVGVLSYLDWSIPAIMSEYSFVDTLNKLIQELGVTAVKIPYNLLFTLILPSIHLISYHQDAISMLILLISLIFFYI